MNNEDRKEALRLANRLRSHDPDSDDAKAAAFLERIAAQPAQVPMTEAQMKPLFITYCVDLDPEDIDLVRKIEAHHRITGDKK